MSGCRVVPVVVLLQLPGFMHTLLGFVCAAASCMPVSAPPAAINVPGFGEVHLLLVSTVSPRSIAVCLTSAAEVAVMVAGALSHYGVAGVWF